MLKNRLLFLLILIFINFSASAQSVSTIVKPGTAPKDSAKQSKSKKKININFEDEVVTGNYDIPDSMFMSSRKLIKYKELFNKRTNFIEEIDSNKGLFNEH